MKYDDASWHYGGEFPEGQPDENGGTHIGLYLRWCFIKGWAGALHKDEWPDAVEAVVNGRLTASDFLFKYCDGKFTDEDLNDEGNLFTQQYYGDDGLYLSDYEEVFGDLMYIADENGHDFDKFSSMIDARLNSNVLTTLQSKPMKFLPMMRSLRHLNLTNQ